MFVNTQNFREAALHFKKYGRYADGDYGSLECVEYWKEEEKRIINGYTVGGQKVTGKHYLYLNYLPIILINEEQKDVENLFKSKKRKGKRASGFVDFWDEDYILFHTWDIAEYGLVGNTLEEKIKELRRIQAPINFNIVENFDNLNGGKNHLWLKPRGVGAEQPLTEILITPNGEISMGDVKIGTELFDRHGKITKVTEILPQGYKEVWKVKLLDGREVECGEKHLWTVETRIRNGKPEYKTLTTKQMLDSGLVYNQNTGQKTYKYKIPELKPVQLKEVVLPIPPYVLGALLGDGAINGKNIRLSSDDIEIVDKVIQDLNIVWKDSYEYSKDSSNNNYLIKLKDRNEYLGTNKESYGDNTKFGCSPLKRELELLNVNKKCSEKFIPFIYKYSSVEQRLELVKGLMDTDGSISEQGYCEFTNSCEQLVDDLAYVLRSLGIYCSKGISDRDRKQSIADRTGRLTTFTENKYFRLYIATNINLFNLKRKSCRTNYSKKPKTSCPIVSIENTKILVKQQCIIVDNKEHLYLTRDFVVTHNSWKGAVIPIYQQFFVSRSNTFLAANEEKYLTGDGIFTKYLEYKNTLNGKLDNWRDLNLKEDTAFRCAGLKRAFSKNDFADLHYRASIVKQIKDGDTSQPLEVGGKRSSVYGVPINNKASNIRGKRGHIVYEEFGSFPGVKDTWEVAQQGIEQDGIVYGSQFGFGTGGDESANHIEDLTKMMYDPATYNILEFNNIYDIELRDTKIGYFTPATKSLSFIDGDGNTNVEESKEYQDSIRAIKKAGKDDTVYLKYCAEKPNTPSEALTGIKGNIFPVKELQAHKLALIAKGLDLYIQTGRLKNTGLEVKFVKTDEEAFVDYPIKRNTVVDSPIVIHKPPIKRNGFIPKNLYRISVDAYKHDTSSGDSVGAVYVFENVNPLTPYKGDRLVAWYIARPERQDTFNENLFLLAEYYNAKIAIENDEPGDIIGYAKRFKKIKWLEEQFELAFDETITTKAGTKRQFGMHMAGGAENKRIRSGDLYIKEWLNLIVGIDETGKILKNLHFIFDLGLLEELITYGKYKNYDRVASFRISMYHEQENMYKEQKVQIINNTVRDSFFTNQLFQ